MDFTNVFFVLLPQNCWLILDMLHDYITTLQMQLIWNLLNNQCYLCCNFGRIGTLKGINGQMLPTWICILKMYD